MVVTRFAPSPTGFLHIGGARTGLVNWLYARRHGGKFLLRIEDTDRQRSTQEAVDAILGGLKWLALDWDGEPVSQFARQTRHVEVARHLLESGHAYRCYCSEAELAEMREAAKREGRPMRYDGRWRDRDQAEAPAGVDPVIRFRAPRDGETTLPDLIQGEVTVGNGQMDDLVLLRADGTPTYNLAVVVDDHDMEITHVIRGDDHLTNSFRQAQIYRALNWPLPAFAHMPLLHGEDGKKLSKRHGALAVEAYRDMGFLPEAMSNYLLRLGWSHGDDEIISREQAIAWFDLDAVGRGAARFDMERLTSLNAHYLREADDERLIDLIWPGLEQAMGGNPDPAGRNRLQRGISSLKERSKNILELIDNSTFYVTSRPIGLEAQALKILSGDAIENMRELRARLADFADWSEQDIEAFVRSLAEETGQKLGGYAQPLRAALTGRTVSPSIFEVMAVLGKEETLGRLDDVLTSH